jgi:hypothetical protein
VGTVRPVGKKWHQIILVNTAFDVTCGSYKQQRLSSYRLLNTNKKRQNITLWHCGRNMTKIGETRCKRDDFLKTERKLKYDVGSDNTAHQNLRT